MVAKRVVVVTGGGGGIGAAIAEELGRNGDFVVTLDPLVSLDGSEQLPPPEETTAGRIVAAGGAARASSASVTDAVAVRALFEGLVGEFGRLDAVVNVAGISRPTSFAGGEEQDWNDVLTVHLGGYLNVLGSALPLMAEVGHGRIVGVTSGSGWRAADAGAYGCAKRAVASLTWQLGDRSPPGVTVNALSPIAMTRMVTAALGRATRPSPGGPGTGSAGGLSLATMPTPEQLGPIGAYLLDDAFTGRGQVVFAGGSEIAVIDRPRFLEVARTDHMGSLALALETLVAGALVPAEAGQKSNGGSTPRFGSVFDQPAGGALPSPVVHSCVVVTDRPEVAAAVTAALAAREVVSLIIEAGPAEAGFDGASAALAATVERDGPLDAVIVALAGPAAPPSGVSDWERVLTEHTGIVDQIHTDAGWARAVADQAQRAERPVRLVTLTDATTAGGRTRAQASAQLARAAMPATAGRVAAFAVSVETSLTVAGSAGEAAVGELVAHLLCSPGAGALSGAELALGAGWVGLRSHPRPLASVAFGGPAIPDWLHVPLQEILTPAPPVAGPEGPDR